MNLDTSTVSDQLLMKSISILAIDPKISEEPIYGKVTRRLSNIDAIAIRDSGYELASAYAVQLDEPLIYYDFFAQPKRTELSQIALIFWSTDDINHLLAHGSVSSCDIHLYAATEAADSLTNEMYGLSKEVEVTILQ